jgi:hypothetical protein
MLTYNHLCRAFPFFNANRHYRVFCFFHLILIAMADALRTNKRFANRLKISLCLFFFSGPFFSSGQYFNIFPGIRDSIDANTYHYAISGVAQFPDSVTVFAELLTDGEEPQVLFSGMGNISEIGSSTLPAFTYDPVAYLFSFEPGDFPSGNLYLHIWIVVNGLIENETYFRQ